MRKSSALVDHLLIEVRLRVLQFSKAYYRQHKEVASHKVLRAIVYSAIDEVSDPYLRVALRRGFRGVLLVRSKQNQFSVRFKFTKSTRKSLQRRLGKE